MDDDVDLELIRSSAREFLTASHGRTGEPGPALADLAALDWLGLLVAEQHGGAGWRPVEACVIAEELGRAGDPSPWFGTAMAAAAVAAASEDVRRRWLPGLLAGATPAGFAPDGAPEDAPDDAAGGAPGGAEVRIAAGERAQLVVVAGSGGVRLVELTDAHVRRPDPDSLDVARPVWCVEVSGAAGQMIGDAEQARRLAAVARLLIGADALGALSGALARLVAYLRERIAFGVPIASFQAVQHRLVDLLVFEVKARAMIMKAARSGSAADALAAHAFVAAGATAAIDECMQLSGGIGFTWEYPLHHEMRRAATDAVLCGTARDSRTLLAEVWGW
ncbi:acyl-CoA dehydrogenase family protein [Mycolicibacterium thermoresistibile]|uniref:Acyl-CoA dehydrogenase n=2 Tax=Mycolicibacterium thermoresistibile TaxID=1797 RepID=G7CN45_MYCT3|nr:acyl-CoA dehydrogenase family protein [Mycolicibacterium thermoresistibile]EHI10534.1 acyl-CoA dehydrogenase [Mycolicibacterium thermoresistibile ATCC 19527]MCV7189672.1 acyl-CoA/acyl-ACP dehydrogenase [Mycolicibacterium thermoresistibile]GAT15414.1 acyl-CoA dehydrogenase [Mycolicibacterium thermoresistibile]SNW17473.1 acyl-CoA dehydrogenase [Mycolicibacterium thermoresistibile]